MRRALSGRRRPYVEVAFFTGEQWREGKMSFRKAVFIAVIFAGYAYSAFWIAFFVNAIMAHS
jgi:hypothetical protein